MLLTLPFGLLRYFLYRPSDTGDQDKENFAEMYMPLLLALCIGTRISETIAIKYADIDFTAGTIYIRRQIGHKLVVYDSDDITDEPESNFSDVTTTTTKTQRGI